MLQLTTPATGLFSSSPGIVLAVLKVLLRRSFVRGCAHDAHVASSSSSLLSSLELSDAKVNEP